MRSLTSVGPVSLAFALAAIAVLAPRLWAEDAKPALPPVKAEINADGLAALMRARAPMVVLDARGPMTQFIPNAKPLVPNAPASTVASLIASKTSLVVTYDSGPRDALGKKLAERLARDGYQNVIRLPGGVQGWVKARYKLAKKPAPRPPAGSGRRGSGGR